MGRSDHGITLVTGASSGIGHATALALAEAGYRTYATARRREALEELERSGLSVLPLDVTEERSMVDAVAAIEAAHGAVDLLVNNAGYSEMGPIEEVTLERVRRQFETNVFGLVRLCQLVLPGMRRAGRGRIVNVSSMGGEFTMPYAGIYHASKYAVESISDALRFEVRPFGIDVIVIQPGVVRTPLGAATAEAMRTPEGSPYAAHVARVRSFIEANADDADSSALAPEDVARVIVGAVTAGEPATRYKVGMEAEQITAARRALSDREWDAMFGEQFGIAG